MDFSSDSTQLSQEAAEELESIQAIYCKPDEFNCCQTPEGRCVTVCFDVTLPHRTDIPRAGIHVLLPHDYPSSAPKEMNVFCDSSNSIPAASLHSMTRKTEERAESLKGEPMLLDLVCFVQELFESFSDISGRIHGCEESEDPNSLTVSPMSSGAEELNLLPESNSPNTDVAESYDNTDVSVPHSCLLSDKQRTQLKDVNPRDKNKLENKEILTTALLHLDHMRSRQNYIKLIQRWMAELGLNGRLLFYGRFIFILLQGHHGQVKEYILRNKTMIVDVDSKGRPCKERMLSVLCESASDTYMLFKDFITVDSISTLDDFSGMFQSFSMTDVFKEYIEPVVSVKAKTKTKTLSPRK